MDNNPSPPIRLFRPGRALSADELNSIVKSLISQISGDNATIKVSAFGNKLIISQIATKTNPVSAIPMLIEEIKNTYLVCAYGTDSISVAKPWGLRKETAWPSEDGDITYVYASATQRTASKADQDDEIQYLTPPYEVGEEILAKRLTTTKINDDSGNPIKWEDTNFGGRCWATEIVLEEYLPLAGGTMAGGINMDGNSVSGAVITGSTISGGTP